MNQQSSTSISKKNPNNKRLKLPHNQRPDEARVVVTGMGAITPLGLDVQSTWTRLINRESGITTIEHFDASDYRTQIAGTVKDFDAKRYMNAKDARRYDEFIHYGIAASSMALKEWVVYLH